MSVLRAWAARAWLRLLFAATACAPGVLRVFRPVIIAGTWRVSPATRRGTMANAQRILGPGASAAECRKLGRRVVGSFFDSVVEFGANRDRTAAELRARIEAVEGLAGYERARALRRGAILVTAHLGSFETAVASLREREPRVHVVFQRDRFEGFERLRARQRSRLGVIEAPVDDGLAVWFRLRDALGADEVVLMQGDRTMPGQRGRAMPFLHGHVELPDGPVRLAELTGAPIIPTFAIVGAEGRVRIVLRPAIVVGGARAGAVDAKEAMSQLARSIAEVVARHPEQWLALEPMWVEDRAGGRG